ncbi:caspase family protein [Paraburkholderia sp. MM6662-R1]|uniref:caspase family protein n=1 Tax=Paraburkholderia sp. MM6662-R1 TaxID=2991066 RepID=UPI003D190206
MKYPPDLSYESESRVIFIGTTRCHEDMERLPPLPQVENNIADLRKLFGHPHVVGLPPACITTLIDVEEAGTVVRSVARYALEATDTLLIYYSGHGLYGDRKCPLYLAAGTTTSDMKRSSAIRVTDIKDAMRDSPARKRILILDCCYAGRALDGEMSGGDDVGDAIDISGTYGIGAVPGDYKALAPPGERLTSFTKALVNVLDGGIATAGAVLTVDQVFQAVKRQVGRESDMPLPQRNNSNDGGLFKIARNRALESPREDVLSEPIFWRAMFRKRQVFLVGHIAVRVFLTDAQGKVMKTIGPEDSFTRLVIELQNILPYRVEVMADATCEALSQVGGESFHYQQVIDLAPASTQISESPVRLRPGSLSVVGKLTLATRTSRMTSWRQEPKAVAFSVQVRNTS